MERVVTLVTGASAGLGAEFARQCARRGEELVLVARRRDRLEALAGTLGGTVHVVDADLSAVDAARRLVSEVESRGLTVGTLINNAGFGLAGDFAKLPLDRQAEMIELNVAALTRLCHLVLPRMLGRREGAILNVASTAAFQPGPHFAVYFATKAYVLSFTEALAEEVAGTGVRVSCLAPGPTQTGFQAAAGMQGARLFRMRAMDAAEVARVGYRGFRAGRTIVVPGWRNKLTTLSVRFVPRSFARRVAHYLQA